MKFHTWDEHQHGGHLICINVWRLLQTENNHLARVDYGRGTKIQGDASFANVSEEMIDAMEEIAKGTKDATEFGGTLFRRKIWSFFWFN